MAARLLNFRLLVYRTIFKKQLNERTFMLQLEYYWPNFD